MLTSIRSLMAASALAGGLVFAAPAYAQDESASQFEVSANAAVVSEYRFRGIDLSGGDVAIQGGVDVSHSSGLYVGTWGSSIDETTVGFGHTELDVYGGWTGDLADGVSLDVGAIYYMYPNQPAVGDFDYIEGYASLGFTLGPVESSIGVAYAPEQDSLGGQDNFYIYTDVGFGLPGTPLSISGHLGYTDGFLTYTADGQAFDWSIGADLAINELLSVGVAYVEAEGGPLTPGAYNFVDDTIVGTLSASF